MQNERFRLIMKTSLTGIAVNVVLALIKVITGTMANSIAIVLDGINNLSDAGSSLITMIGTALAGRPADKKHPFGYGRMEYLSSLIISALVLYAGISSFSESVDKIIHPAESEYSVITLCIVAAAVAVKALLALYTGRMGKKANSDSLIASGKEAMMDAAVSTVTLVTALLYLFSGISLEAWLGAVIAVIIIKAGIELLGETISRILGEPSEVELAVNIKKTVYSFPEVNGVYDLVMNNYGPETYFASVHIEVNDTLSIRELDTLTRKITDKVLAEQNVYLTAVGIYAKNTKDQEMTQLEENVKAIALRHDGIKAFHGFYADIREKKMSFDLVVTLNIKDRLTVFDEAVREIKENYPEFTVVSSMDMDMQEALQD